jgi:hypothetical protein
MKQGAHTMSAPHLDEWAQAPYLETIVVGPQIGADDGPGGAP